MSRVFAILAIFIGITAISLSLPNMQTMMEENQGNLIEIDDKQVGLPTDQLLKALESQFNDDRFAEGRGAGYFNLSSYLNTNRPNGTAITFIPLITLLLGLTGTGGVG